ncbi:hypothetical protein SNS2_0390 [Streptomyces netropsis]|nr:hypothetical protein SNS2_0390 [Streptomyces netropsis]
MFVAATFRTASGKQAGEFTAVDGNSRLVSCWAQIAVRKGWLDGSEDSDETFLAPSDLLSLSLDVRRELVRHIIRDAYEKLDDPASSIATRNKAAKALNALTVPAQVIVGYEDDDASLGMKRFPAAVRSLLLSMNVGVKQFNEGARNAVRAEEIVSGLYAQGHLGDLMQDGEATRDVLVGRGQVSEAMAKLGLNPVMRDLRFAFIVHQFTKQNDEFTSVVRAKLQISRVYLKHRHGPVTELALRSYSASKAQAEIESIRLALESQCLWQSLVTHPWEVENLDSDEDIDTLYQRAETGQQQARAQLGVLGMIALVITGNLKAPRGSAEGIVGHRHIDRGPVGHIVEELLAEQAGRAILSDAVKRSRAGQRLRWWDAETQRLVEQPADWTGADFDAHLRLAVREGFAPHEGGTTSTKTENELLTAFQHALTSARYKLGDLVDLRHQNQTHSKVSYVEVQAQLVILDRMKEDLLAITDLSTREE